MPIMGSLVSNIEIIFETTIISKANFMLFEKL